MVVVDCDEGVRVGRGVVPWNWGSMTVFDWIWGWERERDSTELVRSLELFMREARRGEPACLWPSLWMAKWSFEAARERIEPLMFCFRDGSGVLRPKRDSKESRLRYVRSADIRAAPRPVDGGCFSD